MPHARVSDDYPENQPGYVAPDADESTTDEAVDDTVIADPAADEPVSVYNPDPDGSGGTHTSEVAAPTAPKTSRRK